MAGCSLRGADLYGADLDHCDLTLADTTNAMFARTIETLDANLRRAILDHGKWVESSGRAGARAEVDGADLRGIDLSGVNLSGAVLRNVICPARRSMAPS